MFTVKNKLLIHRERGFTLLEILIALFIFSIVSLMLAGGLRTVIDAQSRTEAKAERLRSLQMVLLILSRDLEQAVNRPITNAVGKEEAAFIGGPQSVVFTHTGQANPTGMLARSSLQRSEYRFSEQVLWRRTWPALDQASQTTAHNRQMLAVSSGSFKYLDKEGRYHDEWSASGNDEAPLPRAVKVTLTLPQWGSISQLYVLPVELAKSAPATEQTKSGDEKTGEDK